MAVGGVMGPAEAKTRELVHALFSDGRVNALGESWLVQNLEVDCNFTRHPVTGDQIPGFIAASVVMFRIDGEGRKILLGARVSHDGEIAKVTEAVEFDA